MAPTNEADVHGLTALRAADLPEEVEAPSNGLTEAEQTALARLTEVPDEPDSIIELTDRSGVWRYECRELTVGAARAAVDQTMDDTARMFKIFDALVTRVTLNSKPANVDDMPLRLMQKVVQSHPLFRSADD